MAKKGHNYKQKALSVAPVRHLLRKANTWTIRATPGAHASAESIPLGFVVRDMLQLSKTGKETKHILGAGNVRVDSHVRRDPKFGVGLFDTVSVVSTKKNYRLLYDRKGRLLAKEVAANEANVKPAKVLRKTLAKGKKLHAQTHAGRVYPTDAKTSVGDSILVDVNTDKISGHLPLAKGARVYIVGGTHVGEIANVTGIVDGTMKRDKLVDLSEGSVTFQTTAKNVMVIDENTAKWISAAVKEEAK